MLVSDILRSKGSSVKMVQSYDSAMSCAQRLKSEHVGALVVSDDGRSLDGMISERDIAYGLATYGGELHHVTVRDLMTRAVVTCAPRDTILNAMSVMTRRRVRHLPVVESGKLVGLVSTGDVLKYRLQEMQLETNVLRDVVVAAR
ncbi:MAG: CBS domain-containing protein [Hyphomicrobiaceae bacterium]|nr:CBS domain-containing protein [Hyphomicrobiaceae bacterium]